MTRASVLIYCDDHAAQPIGPSMSDAELVVAADVFVLAQYRRDTIGTWLPESVVNDADPMWVRHSWHFLDAHGQPVDLSGDVHDKVDALERAGDGALDRVHVKLRHRGCRRNLPRLSQARLSKLLDHAAAQGFTGISMAKLDRLNSTLKSR